MKKLCVIGWITARYKEAGSDEWKLLFKIPVFNTIVNVALAEVAKHLGDGAALHWTHGAIGEGATAPQNTDTVLEDEVDRQAVAFSRETTSVTNDTAKFVTSHTAPGGGWSITEYGLFTGASGGTMYNRVTFTAISMSESDQLEFTYKSQVQRV